MVAIRSSRENCLASHVRRPAVLLCITTHGGEHDVEPWHRAVCAQSRIVWNTDIAVPTESLLVALVVIIALISRCQLVDIARVWSIKTTLILLEVKRWLGSVDRASKVSTRVWGAWGQLNYRMGRENSCLQIPRNRCPSFGGLELGRKWTLCTQD